MSINAIVYDLEIKKAIPPDQGKRLEGIDYCAGWSDHKGMGISVLGCYDYKTNRYRVFCDDNLSDFAFMVSSCCYVVGFNNICFDNKVCEAQEWISFLGYTYKNYDISGEIYRAKGLKPFPDDFTAPYRGYSLNAICQANGLGYKSGHGEQAPVQWQQGKIGSVIDYCLHDVSLTKALFDRILAGQPIVDPKTLEDLYLRSPFDDRF